MAKEGCSGSWRCRPQRPVLGPGPSGWRGHGHGCGVALFPVFLDLAFAFLFLETFFAGRALDSGSDVPELRAYAGEGLADIPQPQGDITVRGFEQPAPDNGVLHTKMVIADGQRATVLGSPYSQQYFDDPRHQIDNPERGDTTSDIVHDVSVGLVGPVVGDLHETFRVYWNEDQPSGSRSVAAAGPGRHGSDFGTGRVVQGPGRPAPSARAGSSFLDGRSEKGILGYLRVRSGETVHLPGEPVLHRRDHRRRPGQGSEGQAGP